MAAKKPLKDPAVPNGAVDGVNPADESSYKGFNFDMGTVNQNITCNSCHAGGGAAQFGREKKPLDEVLKEKLGEDTFNDLENSTWFIRDDSIVSKVGIDGDFFAYSEYEVGAGYIGKPGVFNFKRSGVNDTDCFMCHADASDKTVRTRINNVELRPIMPANPRVMVFRGIADDNETIVISLGVPPKVGEMIGGKKVERVDSAYYYSVPIEVLKKLYNLSDDELNSIKTNNGTWSRFFIYPNNANGATREVARAVYFEHSNATAGLDGGEVYVNGGAVTFKDGDETVYRTFAGFFFKYISTASLMGVDTDGDGVPLAYVRFVKENGIWKPEVYYNKREFNDNGEVALPILENREEDRYTYSVLENSGKLNGDSYSNPTMKHGEKDREWGYVCSYCHMAIPYESGTVNDEKVYAWVTRKGTLGLAAEIVKRGDVFSYDVPRKSEDSEGVIATVSDIQSNATAMNKYISVESSVSDIPIGYDVHFDKNHGKMTCLSCHGEGMLSEEEKALHPIHHDFLKGNDWGGHWDQSLDYNPSLKTCIDCHFDGSRKLAAEVHRERFGKIGTSAIHMEKVACEVCHIPYKTHWTFRTFYDVLGYSYNFDNRILDYDLENNATIPLPKEQFTPGFGPFMPIAGYGAPQPFPIVRTDNGSDVLVPIYKVDFDPRQAALRTGNSQFKMWEIPEDTFPWGWAPVIINNGFRPDSPGGQKFMYRIANPLTLVTWYDKSTGKVLYTREMAAALDGAVESEAAGKKVPAYFIENGKVCVKTILGKFICDDNGDYLPEIDTDTEYEYMKAALTEVLKAEGVKNPEPVFYLWVAPFSIDHGVLPKEYALGAGKMVNGEKLSCSACHDAENGRLPQANADELAGLSSFIEKDSQGRIKFFGLGRKVVTVPIKIPEEAYKEAIKVFFNSPENDGGSPKYGTMSYGNQTFEVMYTTAGDLLVNALSNGLDVDRHLVPIPVESSGVDGVAFALPEKVSEWEMRFEGIPMTVHVEALENDEMPRRAMIVRMKNELPELLGLEHLADEIVEAGSHEEETEPVFTPMIVSHLIEKLEFNLSDLGVISVKDLYINFADIVKVRKSEGEEVKYEVDEEKFKPQSIPLREAIEKGWAYFDGYERKLVVNTRAIREDAGIEGELALSLVKSLKGAVSVTATVRAEEGKVEEFKLLKSYELKDVPSKLGRMPVKGGISFKVDLPNGTEEIEVTVTFSDKLKNPVLYKKTKAGSIEEIYPDNKISDGSIEILGFDGRTLRLKIRNDFDNHTAIGDVDPSPDKIADPIYFGAAGVESLQASGRAAGGGGGGGCSMSGQPTASGLLNLGVLLSGLLGLFGIRRRKH